MRDIDFGRRIEAALEAGNRRSAEFAALDGYYVIYTGELFKSSIYFFKANYDRLLKDDPRFLGLVIDRYAPPAAGPFANLRRITADEFLAEREARNVGLVHFFTTKFEFAFWARLRPYMLSFVSGLDAGGLVHTYVPVRAEREFIRDNVSRFAALIDRFEDEPSRRMMTARLQGISALDIEPLVNNNVPLIYEYFNAVSADLSFRLRDREDFVDVGASWGDCVVRFAEGIVDLSSSSIRAFEPNAVEFEALRSLEPVLPMVADNAIVSDVTGAGYFQTDGGNLLGSRRADGGAPADERRTVRLDDACERASLIKIDAEGAEPAILRGAERLLSDPDCRLAVCAYHYPTDLFEIIDIMAGYGRKRFFFRQHNATLYDALLYFG